MSIARHHAEWLSLIETSGPFLSLPVLMQTFPQGLPPRDPERAQTLRLAYAEWQEQPKNPARFQAWVRVVLTGFLGYDAKVWREGQSLPPGLQAEVAIAGETLRPDGAVVGPDGHPLAGQAQVLVRKYPPGQNLDAPVAELRWRASPATRMSELLHATGTPLGLVTNGEQWLLVYARSGETSGFTTWQAGLWLEEPITARAFQALLEPRRLFGVAENERLAALFAASAQNQQEVTEQLGGQVRRAVEVLVQAFDRLDQDHQRQLLVGVLPATLYEAALTVMMRLVFLFSAEERGLLRLGEPLYDANYALSTLREQLREAADQHGEEVLERRADAWARLLATFRAVHGGVTHEAMSLPAYGGTLFDPDRFAFLEGRASGTRWRETPAQPLRINNRVTLHLLESLQVLRVKVPGGGPAEARRLSFRGLDIEQIGHVYEGLLDHTAIRATAPVLGLQGSKNQEPEIAMSMLETQQAAGEAALTAFLKEHTGRSEAALRRALQAPEVTADRLPRVCGQEAALLARVRPFAGLLREDSFGLPVVVLPGSVYVTAGATRRSTGTHYTPRSLTEPIVQHTLEPLVYVGPAEGLPENEWRLKAPGELLALKVCDLAMGSGAFLVQVCRYLAERLVEAWDAAEAAQPGRFLITPEGELSQGDAAERLLPQDPTERLAMARRIVADRCLFGVDINPMAVEMAKLSLWLVMLQQDRPFTFLDHALKCGDSLLGISAFAQLEHFSLRAGEMQAPFSLLNLWRHIEAARDKRRQLEALPSDTPAQIAAKQALHRDAETAVAKLQCAADALIGLELRGLNERDYLAERDVLAEHLMAWWEKGTLEQLQQWAREGLGNRRPLHWPLAFPEIMERGGFNAFVGNPPYRHGSRISTDNGTDYLRYLVAQNVGVKGTSDLVIYFLRRSAILLKNMSAGFGLVTTKSITEGDNKKSGLGWLLEHTYLTIYNATKLMQWPGEADLLVSVIHSWIDNWSGKRILNGQVAKFINESLDDYSDNDISFTLQSNDNLCYKGSELLGDGFIISEKEALALLRTQPNLSEIIKPLINGKEFSTMPDLKPQSWVIDFGERDENEARKYTEAFSIVEQRVKPDRINDNRPARRERFWRFGEIAKGLYSQLLNHNRAIARLFTCEYWFWEFLTPGPVFTNGLVIVVDSRAECFAVLTSSIHEAWAGLEASSLLTRFRYTPSRCFKTFPFPYSLNLLASIGLYYQDFRRQTMQTQQEGLTKTYNRFHDPKETAADIQKLRKLHVEMDEAVAAAYGWSDLKLQHGFHDTKQGLRYTISEAARREVLDRLLRLNHERYAEEVKQGLHDKKGGKRKVQQDEAGEEGEFSLAVGDGGMKKRGRKAK